MTQPDYILIRQKPVPITKKELMKQKRLLSNRRQFNFPNHELCENIPFILPANSSTIDFCSAKGLRLMDVNDYWAFYLIPHKCPHYFDGKCNIYKQRPAMCKRYPHWLYRELDDLGLTVNPKSKDVRARKKVLDRDF